MFKWQKSWFSHNSAILWCRLICRISRFYRRSHYLMWNMHRIYACGMRWEIWCWWLDKTKMRFRFWICQIWRLSTIKETGEFFPVNCVKILTKQKENSKFKENLVVCFVSEKNQTRISLFKFKIWFIGEKLIEEKWLLFKNQDLNNIFVLFNYSDYSFKSFHLLIINSKKTKNSHKKRVENSEKPTKKEEKKIKKYIKQPNYKKIPLKKNTIFH